jgi:acyl dehydratase
MMIAWPDIVDPKTRDIDFGPGAWRTVTGEQVDLFARATGDLQFVHLDPERAKLEGPFGGAYRFAARSQHRELWPRKLAVRDRCASR